ncbi:MAG: hypothetical protein O3B75_10465, partial [Planctomycetota bacterium]|nr:hypothetical protein [Planctomycetota bacterium]
AGAGNILFSSTLDGAQTLGLTAGAGDITFTGAVGGLNALDTVTVVSALQVAAGNGVAQNEFNAGTLTLTSVTGTATFTGALNLTTLSATGGVFNFTSTGTGGTIVGAVVFTNTGALTLGQAGGTQTFTGGLNTVGVGGSVTMNGTFDTGAADITLGAITLGAETDFNFNGTLTVGEVTGSGFDLTASVADLVLTGNISNVGTFTIENFAASGNITLMGAGGLSIETQAEWDFIQGSVGLVVLGSTATNTGEITVAGAWQNNRTVDVDFLSGGAGEFNVNGEVTGTGSLTVNGSGNSTNINADMIQASFNILDSVVVGGGVTRTLTSTGVGGIVINSTGFANGISADVIDTSLSLLTTFVPVLPADPSAPISVTGTFTALGGSALTNLTMGGDGVDAGTITLVASGTILGALSADNASDINVNSNAGTLTAASMFFGEDTTLTGTTILVATAGDINFGTDPATATLSGEFGITLTASGNATFTDLITLTGAAGSFAFTGNNLTLNGVGTNAIATTMTVTNTGLFTTYNGGLAPTGADLVVGSDFVQNGEGPNSIGGNITSTADGISFATGVTLTNNVTMTSGLLAGDDISFATAIRSDVSTTRDLTLTAGLGDIALNDGTSTTTLLDAILINSARNVVVGDAITATSFIQLAGTGSTTFQGALSFTGELTVNAGTSEGNTITFASTVGSVTASSVNLNTLASSARATPATVATIVSGGNIAFSSGTFDMGLNQKLTGLGNITIGGLLPATNATTVTLGDVNAVGNLSVNSDVINLRARASGPIVTNTGGTITDPMVDYIVGGRVFFSVAPVMVGSGGRAVFANTSGNVDGVGTLGAFVTSIYQTPITAALLTGAGGQILDLSVSNSLPFSNPANIIPPSISVLPPIGVLGSSDELEQNEKKKAKPEAQGSKKTASETPKTAPGIPVALR